MKSRPWTGPDVRRLRELADDKVHIDEACEALGRSASQIAPKCQAMGITIKGMYAKAGLKKDWFDAYNHGKKAKTKGECPYSRLDLYHFCAWMAGYSDKRMGYV